MYIGTNKIRLFLLVLILSICQTAVSKNKARMSLEEASDYIRESTNGKVMSARTIGADNSKSHRIQVLTKSGRVKVYMVPAYEKKIQYKNSNHFNSEQQGINNNSRNNYSPPYNTGNRNNSNIKSQKEPRNHSRSRAKNRSQSRDQTQSQRESKQK